MLELPEVNTLVAQANKTLKGKKIAHVFNATKSHKFTFYNGDPLEYGKLLTGKTIEEAKGFGMFVDLCLTGNTIICIGDGVNACYAEAGTEIPKNYQLLIGFEDESFLVFTVAMYGFINVYVNENIDNKYYLLSKESISPLSDSYTEELFEKLFTEAKPSLTAKALLASEQRIPGVGNGVLQDILFNAKIRPKTKISALTNEQKKALFHSLKNTLRVMTEKGGRDTQKDLYGNNGGYASILSSKTWKEPCPVCGGTIIKEAFMGGTVYYCPNCQV